MRPVDSNGDDGIYQNFGPEFAVDNDENTIAALHPGRYDNYPNIPHSDHNWMQLQFAGGAKRVRYIRFTNRDDYSGSRKWNGHVSFYAGNGPVTAACDNEDPPKHGDCPAKEKLCMTEDFRVTQAYYVVADCGDVQAEYVLIWQHDADFTYQFGSFLSITEVAVYGPD